MLVQGLRNAKLTNPTVGFWHKADSNHRWLLAQNHPDYNSLLVSLNISAMDVSLPSSVPISSLQTTYANYILAECPPPLPHAELRAGACEEYNTIHELTRTLATNLQAKGTAVRDQVRAQKIEMTTLIEGTASSPAVQAARQYVNGIQLLERLVSTLNKLRIDPVSIGQISEGSDSFATFVDVVIQSMKRTLQDNGYQDAQESTKKDVTRDPKTLEQRWKQPFTESMAMRSRTSTTVKGIDEIPGAMSKVICYRSLVADSIAGHDPEVALVDSSKDIRTLLNITGAAFKEWKVLRNFVLVAGQLSVLLGVLNEGDFRRAMTDSESRLCHTLFGFVCCISPMPIILKKSVTSRINSEAPIQTVR